MSALGSGTPQPETDGTEPSLIRRILQAVRHPLGGASWPVARDHQASISFEDAERAAFRTSTAAPAPEASIASQLASPPASSGSPTFMLEPVMRVETAADFRPTALPEWGAPPTAVAQPEVAQSEALTPELAVPAATPELPGGRARRQPGDTAPESLLRTPTGAASVADDFFDGLIRRVEGDR